ncbi:MAG: YkgJ family cysteine cluster protein [Thermoanaerobaculia bacterium]
MSSSPWYGDGLRFTCSRCGRCCTIPGYVWVVEEEITRLAERLGLSRDEFGKRYLRRVGRRLSLIETAGFECVFWSAESGCTVYEDRPRQCRTFPFWPENVESPEEWATVVEECPGAGEGRLYTPQEIVRLGKGSGGT